MCSSKTLLFCALIIVNSAIDISEVAYYDGIIDDVGWFPPIPNYGGNIVIENHLCQDIIHTGGFVLNEGYWWIYCTTIMAGTRDGCQLGGSLMRGAEGMAQFEVADTGRAFSMLITVFD